MDNATREAFYSEAKKYAEAILEGRLPEPDWDAIKKTSFWQPTCFDDAIGKVLDSGDACTRDNREFVTIVRSFPLVVRMYAADPTMLRRGTGVARSLPILLHQSVLRPSRAQNSPVSSLPEKILGFVMLLVPKRIADENLGDALQGVHAHRTSKGARWRIWTKTISTIFWVGVQAFGEIMAAIWGRFPPPRR